jgi:hypothetical protein
MYKALAATPAPTAGMGMGMGMGTPTRTYLIILYLKPGERAHLQKLVKRERAIPAICMRWALIEMYLRSQFPIQTDRDVRSYGSESTDLGMGWAAVL